MGLEVAEGVVLALPVEVGQTVAEGDVIAEVETDKAIAEVPAPPAGVVTAIEVELEQTVPIGTVLVRIADSADEVGEPVVTPEPVEVPSSPEPVVPVSNGASSNGTTGTRLRPAPIARRAAAAQDIDLVSVPGTGPAGR